ncbi:unnamed protein product [Moneuplotes crassus]|uniref:Uncharacterized protein n=1 Tax=Euplotes crassus TaxID=5936 RepID=A0AAD1XMW1_EUPCR|nr:unnamed protein product [Moneuplotes crassus]
MQMTSRDVKERAKLDTSILNKFSKIFKKYFALCLIRVKKKPNTCTKTAIKLSYTNKQHTKINPKPDSVAAESLCTKKCTTG